MITAGINHFIFLSALMMGLGIYILVSQKNIIRIFTGILLVLISPLINFAAFGNVHEFNPESQLIIFILIFLSILLLITGLIVFYNYYRETGSEFIEDGPDE